jgi:hypothetical protein
MEHWYLSYYCFCLGHFLCFSWLIPLLCECYFHDTRSFNPNDKPNLRGTLPSEVVTVCQITMASEAILQDTLNMGNYDSPSTATAKQHKPKPGIGLSSSNANYMQESTRSEQKECVWQSQASPKASSSLNHRSTATEYPITRIPYWEDTRIMVVTETEAVENLRGGWIVNKKKYLEYPKG